MSAKKATAEASSNASEVEAMESLSLSVSQSLSLPNEDENPLCAVPAGAFQSLRLHVEGVLASLPAPLPAQAAQSLLRASAAPPPRRLGFFGATGAGKSTVVDRLLGMSLLKSAAMGAGTKMLIELLPHADKEMELGRERERNDFLFDVVAVADNTVSDWLAQAKRDAQSWRDNAQTQNEAPPFLKWFVTHLTNEAVQYTPSTFAFESADAEDLPLYQRFLESYGNGPNIRRVASDLFQTVFEDLQQFSVFVQHVSIFGPFHLLRALNATVLDFPGVSDGNWLYEERASLAVKMCTDIYYVTNNRLCNETNERRLLSLSRNCENLSVIVTHCKERIGRIGRQLTPHELSAKLFHDIEDSSWKNNLPIMDLMRQIANRDYDTISAHATGIFGVENTEGEESEYEPRYDAYWNFMVDHMKRHHAQKWDHSVTVAVNQLNHLFSLIRCRFNEDEEKQLVEFAAGFKCPKLRSLPMSFVASIHDFVHHFTAHYRSMQCWLTNQSGYWNNEWRNSQMNDLLNTLISSCYPPLVQSKLFDQQIHALIENFVNDIKEQAQHFPLLKKNKRFVAYLTSKAKERMTAELLGSFRGFRSFFEARAINALRVQFGHQLEGMRCGGSGCLEYMKRRLIDFYTHESPRICQSVLPDILRTALHDFFANQTEAVRFDIRVCLLQLQAGGALRIHIQNDTVEQLFANISLDKLQNVNAPRLTVLDLSELFEVLKAIPAFESQIRQLSAEISVAHRLGTQKERETVFLSGLLFDGLLYNQHPVHDVRVRFGRVSTSDETILAQWTSKDAGLVEAIVHHLLASNSLCRTADYANSAFDLVVALTDSVIGFVETL